MRPYPRLLAAFLFFTATLSASPMLVYLGTYTQTTSRGIYVLRFDPDTGSLSAPELAAQGQNLTFLALAPDHKHLYAAGELLLPDSPKPVKGGVSAFEIDRSSGHLKLLNQEATGLGATTHLVVDATGRMVIAVNYGAGYACSLPILADGRVAPPVSHIQHSGPLGPNKERQNVPHAHSVTLSPDNRFAYVCDLGLDRVMIYALDPAKAEISPANPPFGTAPAGAGPRHSKISSDGKFLYTVDEMGGIVCTYARDIDTGALSLLQTIPTLPPDFKGVSTAAEIRIHPNGRFVYASNRGHESIAVYARDPVKGTLTLVEITPCGGKHPRNFALSPDGNWLLCANRDTDNVVLFKVDSDSGRLTPTGREAKVGMPVCVVFLP